MSRRPQKEIRNVLVIKLGELGEFVLALAAMERIRQAHPKARITLLTTPPFEALAKASPYFNAVETDGRPQGPGGQIALIGRLRRAAYDRVYDLQCSPLTSLYFHLLGPKPPEWSGTALGASHRHRLKAREATHALERQAGQLQAAGVWPDAPIKPGSAPPPDLSWILRKSSRAPGRGETRPFVVLVPGGAANQTDRRWPIERYAELAAVLKADGFEIVIIGGPEESVLARAIQRKANTRDLTGRTDFAQIAVLGATASLVVGNDTGPLHLLAAAGAPTLALFSKSSDPVLQGPRGHVMVIQADDLAELPVVEVARICRHMTPMEKRAPPKANSAANLAAHFSRPGANSN